MRKLLMLGSLMALLVPTASRAQFQLGLRLGFAPAMGDAAKDQKMSDGVKSQIPIQIDAAYKVTPDIALGAYFGYGFAQTGSLQGVCDISVVDCSASIVRFGVQGFFTFNQVKAPLVPWAGIGFGYEKGSLEASGGGAKMTIDYSGFEFLNLQIGGDHRVSESFAFGPYVQLSVAQYSNAKITNNFNPSLNVDGSIADKAIHQWLSFGVRGKFDL